MDYKKLAQKFADELAEYTQHIDFDGDNAEDFIKLLTIEVADRLGTIDMAEYNEAITKLAATSSIEVKERKFE